MLEIQGEDGVILEVLADGEVDPVSFCREFNAIAAVLDDGDLVGGTNTTVEENSWSR